MVESGFAANSTAVSAYRLVAHLGLALALYAAILWTGLGVLRPGPRRLATAPWFRRLLTASCGLVGLTILAGGFVAGLHAGLIYNTWPRMGDGIVPPDYAALQPFVRNLTENLAAVQFDHRLLATVTAIVVLGTVWLGLRSPLPRSVRRAVMVLGAAVVLQYSLGVGTLLLRVPVDLAVAHQVDAVLLLTAALVTLHLDRRAA
jgi:cytochrome c oxidase assembly protein subunit 15